MTKDLISFLFYLKGYEHIPKVYEDCDWGDHWTCSMDDWHGYSFEEFVEHVEKEWKKDK